MANIASYFENTVSQLVGWVADTIGIATDSDFYLCRPAVECPRGNDLSPYEVAYLTGGWRRVLQATVAELVRSDVLSIKKRWQEHLIVATKQRWAGILPIERYVHQLVAHKVPGSKIEEVFFRSECEGVTDLQQSLQDRGYLQSRSEFAAWQKSRLREIVVSHLIGCIAIPTSLAIAAWLMIQFHPTVRQQPGVDATFMLLVPLALLFIATLPAIVRICDLMAIHPPLTSSTRKLLEILRKRNVALRNRVRDGFDRSLQVGLLRGEVALVVALYGIDNSTCEADPLRAIGDVGLERLSESD